MLVIFAGAGASAAVDPTKFPTTAAFYEALPDSVSESPLFVLASKRAVQRFQKTPPDIEDVLWVLREFADVFPSLHREDNILGWLAAGNRIASALGQVSINLSRWLDPWQELMTKSSDLTGQIDTLVYDLYGNSPDADGLQRAWLPLLDGLRTRDGGVEIFTTNYDVVLEDAIELSKLPISLGYKGSRSRRQLDTSRWKRGARLPSGSLGLLTKLHGSVDWQKRGNDILVGAPVFTGDHDRHVILYPGFKGNLPESPFRLFHERLEWALEQASMVTFIGFAFRDDAINTIIARKLRSDCKVIVCDLQNRNQVRPTALDGRHLTWHDGGFKADTVKAILAQASASE